jgi:RsiW-degrading membrane proteinase PrsW (M82 family)
MLILALVIATALPIVVGYIIYSLDFYKTGSYIYILICFAAGLAAYLAAGQLNWLPLSSTCLNDPEGCSIKTVRFIAPVFEEILKALILFFLVRRKNFTYFVDGAIYGFMVGMSFAVVENFQYILASSGTAISTAIGRVITTNLMHAGASSIVGIALGIARFKKRGNQLLISLLGLLPAILLHSGFNILVTIEALKNSILLLVYGVGMGGGATGLTAVIIGRGLKEERTWIEEKLGAMDRVERGEALAAKQLDKVDEVLGRLAEVFGNDKAEKIEKLLLTQARLGILRKTAEKLNDEKMRSATEEQIETLRNEMEALRIAIGSYVMSYLRFTHLEDALSVYNILTTRLQEQDAKGQAPKFNVFANLGKQMEKQSDQASQEK